MPAPLDSEMLELFGGNPCAVFVFIAAVNYDLPDVCDGQEIGKGPTVAAVT